MLLAASIVKLSWPAQRCSLGNDEERLLRNRFQLELLRTEVSSLSQQALHGETIATAYLIGKVTAVSA